MDVLLASFVSYWVGYLVYRSIYSARLRGIENVYRMAMDQAYARTEDLSLLPFCSDTKLREVYLARGTGAARVAEKAMQQRGIPYGVPL